MNRKGFKSQASSSNVAPAFAVSSFGSSFGAAPASSLSYVYEPPDLSLIGDSSIQKAFKSLQKKDSITKAKALEDLQVHVAHLQKKGTILEDAVIEGWVSWPKYKITGIASNLSDIGYTIPANVRRQLSTRPAALSCFSRPGSRSLRKEDRKAHARCCRCMALRITRQR